MNTLTSSTVRRLSLLFVLLLSSLSLAFLLPKVPKARESAIQMKLPPDVSFWATVDHPAGLRLPTAGEEVYQHWKSESRPPSPEERKALAIDTEFEKRDYFLLDPVTDVPKINPIHGLQASIVLSGHDLNDSIHRPERCLPAQGFKELQLSEVSVPVSDKQIAVRRIRCYQERNDPKTGKPFTGTDGTRIRFQYVFYYWFVGSHTVTPSHYNRTFVDMKDRLFQGFDQRWAFVLLGGAFTDSLAAAGVRVPDPFYMNGRSEQETDALLTRLASAIGRESIQWSRIN